MSKKADLSEEDAQLFRSAVAGTRVLSTKTRVAQQAPKVRLPEKRRHQRPMVGAPEGDRLSTETDSATGITLDHTDDANTQILFARSGLTKKRLRQLKKGELLIQARLDMHGMRVLEAQRALERFLTESVGLALSCVLIIYGKGYHSVDNQGVIRPAAIALLKRHIDVVGFCSATPRDGGSGAAYVLLRHSSLT